MDAPYRLVTVPTDLRAVDVEVGDVIALESGCSLGHGRARGISGRGVVIRAPQRTSRQGQVDLHLRGTGAGAGWAPSYAVESISGAVLTLDNYPTGPAGFGTDYTATGAARRPGLEYLGRATRCGWSRWATVRPATPLSFEVLERRRGHGR